MIQNIFFSNIVCQNSDQYFLTESEKKVRTTFQIMEDRRIDMGNTISTSPLGGY